MVRTFALTGVETPVVEDQRIDGTEVAVGGVVEAVVVDVHIRKARVGNAYGCGRGQREHRHAEDDDQRQNRVVTFHDSLSMRDENRSVVVLGGAVLDCRSGLYRSTSHDFALPMK